MYQEESGTPEDFSDTRPRPFSQVPGLWLKVTSMTEDFFAQEAPRASGANALISVLILAAVTAVLSAISTLVRGGIEWVNMLDTFEVDSAPLLRALGILALYSVSYALIMGPVGFYIANGLTYLGARIFGGTGSFSTHVYLQSLWVVPLGIVYSLVLLIPTEPMVGGCIVVVAGLALFIYSIILNVRAIKVTHDLTTGRAVGAIFAPALLLLVVLVPCLVIVVLALLGPAIGNVFRNTIEGLVTPVP